MTRPHGVVVAAAAAAAAAAQAQRLTLEDQLKQAKLEVARLTAARNTNLDEATRRELEVMQAELTLLKIRDKLQQAVLRDGEGSAATGRRRRRCP